jgi:transposase-like protein
VVITEATEMPTAWRADASSERLRTQQATGREDFQETARLEDADTGTSWCSTARESSETISALSELFSSRARLARRSCMGGGIRIWK